MIKFKDTIIKGYKICPLTGKIFNEVTGQIEETVIGQNGRVGLFIV